MFEAATSPAGASLSRHILFLTLSLIGMNAASASPEIPPQFHGTWAASQADCSAGNLIIVQQHAIAAEGGDSGWLLKKPVRKKPDLFVGIYVAGGDGLLETDASVTLRLLSGGRISTNITTPSIFLRCRY